MAGWCQVATAAGDLTVVVENLSGIVLASGYRPVAVLAAEAGWRGPVEPLRATPLALARAFEAYNAGQVHALDQISVRVKSGAFARAVVGALRQVTGLVAYGELAGLAGYPGAARAVGTVCATNPVAVIVPCHRVVRADGSLGGYGYGLEIKRQLLEFEGALLPPA